MPGAGGVIAANFVYGLAKPDGLTMGAFNPAAYFEQLVARPEIKFDWSKFTWIGSPEKTERIFYIRRFRRSFERSGCGREQDKID